MKRTLLSLFAAVLVLSFVTGNNNNSSAESPEDCSAIHQSTKDMHSYVSIFEIPAADLTRAINFYEAILDIKIEKMEFPEAGFEMGLLPYEGQMVTGVLMKGEGYQPSPNGVTIYLNGGEDLQPILDKVEKNGGQVIMPKTPHADESGFFAIFLDTEGNKLGLNSPG